MQVGTDSEGGYLVPDEFEHTLVEALQEENIFRKLAHIIQTASGDRKIPVVASKGTASWVDEEGSITESDDSFGQVSIGAYKLGSLLLDKIKARTVVSMRAKKEINIQIGEQIKAARERAKMTQESLAERIEVSPQYVSDLERGSCRCFHFHFEENLPCLGCVQRPNPFRIN